MSDYSKIPGLALSLIKEKPNFGIELTAEESTVLSSRTVPPLSPFFEWLKSSDPESFKETYVKQAELREIQDYRKNYIVRSLFLQACKKKLLPDFGSTPDEKEYIWNRRYYSLAKGVSNVIGIGSIVLFNFAYMLPRYSQYGLALTLLGNVSIAGTFHMISQSYLEPLARKTMLSHHRLAEQFRDILLELHRNHKLIYNFEPSYSVFPPNPYQQEEDEFQVKQQIYREATADKGTLMSDVKSKYILYPDSK